jgi:purine-nucleoside phosphorylase
VPLPQQRLIDEAVHSLGALAEPPRVGIVLGSGLGGFARRVENARSWAFEDVPHMPGAGVGGHQGRLLLGTVRGVPVACLQGRVHAYEGHAVDRVCFGVTVLWALGCRAVLLSNASGGIAPGLAPGDLILLSDHLNLTGQNPLVGPVDSRVPRFVDMTRAYSPELRALAREEATALGLDLREGVYAALLGPSYETPAEIRMLNQLGASCVGMSTALEVLTLRALGVPTAAVSCVTNLAAGKSGSAINHDEVQAVAGSVERRFESLFEGWIERIGRSREFA